MAVNTPNDKFVTFGAVLVYHVPGNDFACIRVMDASQAACDLLGYERLELMDVSPEQLYHFADAADDWETVSTLGDNGEREVRWTLIHKNGTEIPVDVTARVIASGDSTLILAVIHDVTERGREDTMLEQSKRFEALIQHSWDVFAIIDRHGVKQYMSPAASAVFGRTAGTQAGKDPFEEIHPDDVARIRALHDALLHQIGHTVTTEARIRHSDGSWVYCEVIAHNRVDDPTVDGIVVTYRDITERKRIEQELRDNDRRFRALVKNSSDIYAIVDENGVLQYVSEATRSLLGYDATSRIGGHMTERIHPDDVSWMKRFHHKLLHTPDRNFTLEVRIRNNNNVWRDFEITGCNMFNEPSINGIVLNYHDITERKDTERLLNHMVYHDSLTGIPNRRAFDEHIESQLVIAKLQQKKLALLYVGVDRFSHINDTFGHAVGDTLLQHVSDRLKSVCIDMNETLSRSRGDEFAVLLSDINGIQDARDVAQRILDAFESPFKLNHDYEVYVTVSIGISAFPDDGEDIETLVKHADIALCRAKALGKSRFQVFSPTMNIETYKNFVIYNDLRKALERNELSVVYQPRVQADTGKIVSAEALIRWNHSEWGAISPKDFIPIAEETGLITTVGEWVLRTVCAQNKKWQESGLPSIPISVNFSGLQFVQHDAIEIIGGILEETGLAGEWIEIEITESSLLENEETLKSAITSLREMGIQTSIDDFGTGYSSLSRLQSSRMNVLKIDRSFVQHVDTDSNNAVITKSIIAMAHGLGMTVVAEGVETKAELQFLVKHNCDQIQGYLFSRPVPAAGFAELLRKKTLSVQDQYRERENRRRYFRIQLPHPLLGRMTIARIHGRTVSVGTTGVLIDDVGLGGLRFLSNIRLPINSDIILRFETTIYENISINGHIVWNSELDHGIQMYGMEFLVNDTEVSDLAKYLNKLAIELRQDHRRVVPQCDFYTGNVLRFFTTNC